MSNSVRPHRWQPIRLPCPWDSPGKNTGVGCHFLLQCMKVKSESEVVQSCPTLNDPTDSSPPGSSVHGIFQARVLEWGAIAFSGFPLYSPSNFYILFSPLLTPLPFVFTYGRNAPASGPLHLLFHLPSTCCPLITTQLTLLPPAISL